MKNKFWEFKNLIPNNSADLYIYSEISSWDDEDVTSAGSFKQDLDSLGDLKNLNLYINSPGGSVSDGLAIASMIKRNKAFVTAYIDSMACSIASVIACACDKVVMPSNTLLMIHNASVGGFMFGNAKDFRKQADDLDKITQSLRQTYLNKAGDKLTEEKLIQLMDAESWLSAKESLDLGLCDEIVESKKMVAKFDTKYFSNFINIPDNLKQLLNEKEEESLENENKDNVVKDVESLENQEKDETTNDKEQVEETEEDVENKETVEDETAKENEEQVENKDLEKELNNSNEKIVLLNEQLTEMKNEISELKNTLQSYKDKEDDALLEEKEAYYKEKFENLGASSEFESDEVQKLVKNCVKDQSCLTKLNSMLVNLIDVKNVKIIENLKRETIENPTKIENLLPTENEGILSFFEE